VETTEEYRVGQVIIRQGDEGRAFYVLEKGSVEVVKDDVVLNVLMYPGTIFGELGCILDKPRTSTVRARTQTVVTKYEASPLEELVRNYPEIATRMLETIAGRLARTTQRLADSL
jgi:CRP-like cAMP-binding protein